MGTLFNMYKDTASPDIYQEVRASRQEGEANTKKTQDTAFSMLKKSNVGTLQQQYREGSGRFAGITDPDKKFQVYYDALKALDPQAAQDAAKVYGEERQRRINREIADAYKTSGSTGNAELDALDTAIRELEADIATTEATNTQAKVEMEQADEAQAESIMADQPILNPSIDTSADKPATEQSMTGYSPMRLQDYYSNERKMPTFDISLPIEELPAKPVDIRSQQTPTAGMEDYLPMSRYNNYQPAQRRLASMYRGI